MNPRFFAAVAMLLWGTAQADALALSSPDIADGGPIGKEQVYTRCGGGNLSPALSWTGTPAGTKSLAITAIDLDAKPNEWSHWIVVGLAPNVNSLGKGTPLPAGAKAVMTDFGDEAYGGPCPPAGSGVHHYQFTVWALRSASVQFPAHATAMDVAATLQKDALARASITGTYQR